MGLGWALLCSTLSLCASVLPGLLRRGGLAAFCASRRVQAGLKYWLACSIMLVAILALTASSDPFNVRAGRARVALCPSKE